MSSPAEASLQFFWLFEKEIRTLSACTVYSFSEKIQARFCVAKFSQIKKNKAHGNQAHGNQAHGNQAHGKNKSLALRVLHVSPKFKNKGCLMKKDTQNKSGMFSKVVALGAVVALTAAQAQADLVAPTFSSDDAVTVGGAVLVGLALIWGIKQAIRMAR
jgi:hypothetical protein